VLDVGEGALAFVVVVIMLPALSGVLELLEDRLGHGRRQEVVDDHVRKRLGARKRAAKLFGQPVQAFVVEHPRRPFPLGHHRR
jgi:hypothetical protein